MKSILCTIIFALVLGLGITPAIAQNHIIYSIVQDIPMGEPDEVIKKNYYVNMGQSQGLSSGTTLNVFRTFSRVDPYKSKKAYNHSLKIGELEVIHVENGNAIASLKNLSATATSPLVDINALMIGDRVEINTN